MKTQFVFWLLSMIMLPIICGCEKSPTEPVDPLIHTTAVKNRITRLRQSV